MSARAKRLRPVALRSACMLNRLSLIAAGNDARLAELFARADLKRADCRIDWVSGSDKPGLRGAM